MGLRKTFQDWKFDRAHYPVRWLSYRKRVALDLERAFLADDPAVHLTQEYVDKLTVSVRETEKWVIKLLSVQFAIAAFFVLGFISSNPTLSLFGISLGAAAGVKELLLALWFTLGLLTNFLTLSKDTLSFIAANVNKRSVQEEAVRPFSILSLPAPFNIWTYFPQQYNDWIFPMLPTKVVTALLSILLSAVFMAIFVTSIALSWALFADVYWHPTLGRWSTAILIYSAIVFAAGVVLYVRIYLPLPYRDKSETARIAELEKTNPAAAAIRRRKFFESGLR